MLAQQEHLFPALFQSILKTIRPLMRSNLKQLVEQGVLGGDGEDKDDGQDSDE